MILASRLIQREQLLPAMAVFVPFAALAWWSMDTLLARKPRVAERLDGWSKPRTRPPAKARSSRQEGGRHGRMLEKAVAPGRPLAAQERRRTGQAPRG